VAMHEIAKERQKSIAASEQLHARKKSVMFAKEHEFKLPTVIA